MPSCSAGSTRPGADASWELRRMPLWSPSSDGSTNAKASSALHRPFPDIKSIFLGAGPDEPDCPGILFKGKLPHRDVPRYLNAADIFVLPTLNEGCCNAVVEAMACGLPVVSSDRSFNRDILNGQNSIMVEPTDINAIRDAIRRLKADAKLRETMADAALASAESLNMENRSSRIINFFIRHAT